MNPQAKKALRALFLGGVIPVVAFSVIEDRFGVMWGLVAGMVFGVGEILWEWRTLGRVEAMTWGGNGMILVLGAVSLITQEGIWFKLQPSLIEAAMALALWISVFLGKPLLLVMAKKQQQFRPEALPRIERAFSGLTLRFGVFFALHAALAAWAALHWSTTAWALLKGVGFTVSTVLYLVVETLLLRYRFQPK